MRHSLRTRADAGSRPRDRLSSGTVLAELAGLLRPRLGPAIGWLDTDAELSRPVPDSMVEPAGRRLRCC